MAINMKNKIILAVTFIVVFIIATIFAITFCGDDGNVSGGQPTSAPEGSIVISGIIIPPEDFLLLEQMGELFLNILPRDSIDPANFGGLDEDETVLQEFGRKAAISMYMAGIRELREIILINEFEFFQEMRVVGGRETIYYVHVFRGSIQLIMKDNQNGEIVFANTRGFPLIP